MQDQRHAALLEFYENNNVQLPVWKQCKQLLHPTATAGAFLGMPPKLSCCCYTTSPATHKALPD